MYTQCLEKTFTLDGHVLLRGPCQVTGTIHTTPPIPAEALAAYEAGMYAQDAFPMLSDPEKEFLISGISPEGWVRGVLGFQIVHDEADTQSENGEQVNSNRFWYIGLLRGSQIYPVAGPLPTRDAALTLCTTAQVKAADRLDDYTDFDCWAVVSFPEHRLFGILNEDLGLETGPIAGLSSLD